MKFFLLFAGFLFSVFFGYPQTVVISATNPGTASNPNVILSIQSGTQGVQIPLMDSIGRLSIVATPSNAGILVFDTTTSSVWYNNGGAWVNLGNIASGGGWSLTGNAGTVDTANFVGTTDNTALNFRVNNQPSGRIDPTKYATFFGYQAGVNNLAIANSATGYQALFSNTSGFSNVANGWKTLYSNTSGSENSANGAGALFMNTQGSYNSAVGYDALYMNTMGNNNTCAGFFSLGYNSFGNNNTASGYYSLGNNSNGNNNTASGDYSLFNNEGGSNNVAIGAYSLYTNTNTSDLVAIGDSALFHNAQADNTAIGYQALYANTTGSSNTAVGSGSLKANITATGNTGIGFQALGANTAGESNTATGDFALGNNTTGFGNSAFGDNALSNNNTGMQLTAVGASANVSMDGLIDATMIGSNATVGSSYTIQLGDQNVTAVNSYGTFNTISDGRFKFNIREDVSGLDFILKLRPVTYQLDTRKIAGEPAGGKTLASFAAANEETGAMNIRRTGFIAQEVEKAADESGFDFDAVKKPQNDQDHYSLSYQEFVVPLVKAVQEQQKEIADLRKEIEDLKKLVAKTPNN
jgi:hypothetical protein